MTKKMMLLMPEQLTSRMPCSIACKLRQEPTIIYAFEEVSFWQ
jgi:hypothetical protein